ncbi:MAG: inositol monophosphatase [Geminicoccaceae bacterium]
MTLPATELLRRAEPIAERAAATLVAMQKSPTLDVSRKELRDVVTAADLAAERIVVDGLRELAPDAAILSEEMGAVDGRIGTWIIDPLDGTINYAAGLPWFSVTMAYQEEGSTRVGLLHAPRAGMIARYTVDGIATVNDRPVRVSSVGRLADAVVSVILTSHFSAEHVAQTADIIRRLGNAARGVRIIGSGGLEMALVAMGELDGFVSIKSDIVSYAAAMPLVRAAGGRLTTLDDREAVDADLEKVASNGLIHDELLACLKGA